MRTFGVFQSSVLPVSLPRCAAAVKVCERHPQHRFGGENHRALNEILQFADISRPWAWVPGVHRFRRDRLHCPFHTPSEVLDTMSNYVVYVLYSISIVRYT